MKNKLIFSILLLFVSLLGFGQERTITGLVTDSDGEPVIGATVRVPESSIGTITDVDGSFTLEGVPADVTQLSVSYVGMPAPKLVDITSDYLEVNLGNSSIALDDIVVTGYTSQERTRFTGAAKTVSDKIVEDKSTADITEALAGEVSGVQVINSNGQPGTPATVRIRGFGSVNGNRSPLYVVDGVIYSGSIAAINPADIESTTVLKDASATALYGNRGANGVIVITTKRGRKGESDISVDFKQGLNYRALPYYKTISSPEEYMAIGWEGLENAYGAQEASTRLFGPGSIDPYYNLWDTQGPYLVDPATGQFYPNVNRKYTPELRNDVFFNNGDRTELNVGISGGEGKTTYSTSFGYLKDIGYFLASDFRRFSGRARVDHEVKKWLKGNMMFEYGNTNFNTPGQSTASSLNGFYLARMAPPVYGIYERNPDGSVVQDPIFGGPMYDFGEGRRGFSPLSNIAAVNRYDTNEDKNGNLNGNAQLVATFLKHFDFTTRFGFTSLESDANSRTNPYYGQAAGVGSLGKTKEEVNGYSLLEMLKYEREIEDHTFSITGAHENTSIDYRYQFNSGTGLLDPFGVELDNLLNQVPGASWIRDDKIESYFAIGNYDFQGKYLVNASIRRDGSSRFAKGNRWGTFPAFGLGWVASEESFLDVSWLDYLKLKTSYGETGDFGPSIFINEDAPYRGGGNTFDLSNISGTIPAFPERNVIDPELTWEKSKQFDVGLEFTILKDRVDGTFDYYNKKTDDLYFNRRVGPSAGYALTLVNDGLLLNSGFEFDVAGRIIDKNDLKIELEFIGSTLKNELLEAPIDPATGKEKPLTDEGLFAWSRGHSIFDYYIPEFRGVDSETGWSTWTQYYDDKNGNGMLDSGIDEIVRDYVTYTNDNPGASLLQTTTQNVNEATQMYTGQSAIPELFGSTRLNLTFKGFTLTGQFLYGMGGHGFDGNYAALMDNDQLGNANFHQEIRNRWQNPGDVTDIPKLTNGVGSQSSYANATSTRFLISKDYLILNNLRLNYALAERISKKFGSKEVNFWVSGDNLWAKARRDGYFPWVSEVGVTYRENYDPLSTATLGLNFKF